MPPMRECTYVDRLNQQRCTECGVTVEICVCPQVDELAHERLFSSQGRIMRAIAEELNSARLQFPGNRHMLPALNEEVGELNKALMEHDRDDGETPLGIFREAIQVAVMAIRVAAEGDDNFKYDPEDIFRENR